MSSSALTLADVTTHIVDCPHKTAPASEEGGIPQAGAKDIKKGRIHFDGIKRVSEATYAEWTERLEPQPGDILMTREAPVGEMAIVPPGVRLCLGQRTVLIRPSSEVTLPYYLLYLLQSSEIQHNLTGRAEGSTVAHLNMSEIRGLSLPELPPIADQQAVVDVLAPLEAKAVANGQLLKSLESFAVELAATRAVNVMQVPLGNIASLRRKTVKPHELALPLVHHFSLPSFDQGQTPEVSSPRDIKSNKYAIEFPCVLLSKLNPHIPRTWPVPAVHSLRRPMASTEFLVLEPKEGVELGLLWAILATETFRTTLTSRVTGTTGSHQRVRIDDAIALPVPDVSESCLQNLGPWLSSVVQWASSLRAQSMTLAELRDALLPKLISGEVTVQEAEERVEEVA